MIDDAELLRRLAGGALAGAGWGGFFMSMSKLQWGVAGAVACAGGVLFALQAETRSELRAEIVALRDQQAGVAALRAENRELANLAAEVERLRGEDVEYRQLSQNIADLKRTREARVQTAAATSANNAWQDFERKLMADERLAQAINNQREVLGRLIARAAAPAISAEERTQAETEARRLTARIETMEVERQQFVAHCRRMLTVRLEHFRSVSPPPLGHSTLLPPNFPALGNTEADKMPAAKPDPEGWKAAGGRAGAPNPPGQP